MPQTVRLTLSLRGHTHADAALDGHSLAFDSLGRGTVEVSPGSYLLMILASGPPESPFEVAIEAPDDARTRGVYAFGQDGRLTIHEVVDLREERRSAWSGPRFG